MGICLDQWRVSIGLFHCCIFSGHQTFSFNLSFIFLLHCLRKLIHSFKCICNWSQCLLESSFYNLHFLIVMCLLLIEAGDIESNPGPGNQNSITIMHLNIRSIRHKIDYILDNFTDIDILCFSETQLDFNVSTESLRLSNSYNEPYRKDRNSHGGGLLMYLNSNLIHCRRPDLEIFCPESIWAEIKVKHDTYLIGLFYSPVTSEATFLNSFSSNIEKALDLTKDMILVGDLNEDLLNLNYRNLRDTLLINSLQNVITDATRQAAILDPIIIDLYGIDGDLLNWISDYLDDRKQRVVIRSCMSSFKRVNAGVHQKSKCWSASGLGFRTLIVFNLCERYF